MTNFEKLKSVFDELEIGYDVEEKDDLKIISLEANTHKKVGGFNDFGASFVFDENGKSLCVSVGG